MNKIKHIDTILLSGHWLPCIINGDNSNLTDEEDAQLDKWLADYQQTGNSYIYSVTDEESQFSRDAVTGLMSDCYTVEIWSS